MNFSKSRLGFTALLAAVTAGAGFAAQADEPDLIHSLEKGLWQIRAVGGGVSSAGVNQICVGDPKLLVQLRHGSVTNCNHLVVRSTATSVTISYSCRGSGQGLTTIRKESPKLIQIQSQGIYNGSPFSFSVEGRRSAGC